MKYWLFQNNQVLGPFAREQMAEVQGFSAESLVCPEGRRGTEMGDWQRAGIVPELAEAILKKTRVSSPGRATGTATLALPPEPTLRDLAALGSLQEKSLILENAVTQLQEDLRSRDLELSRLKVDLAQKEKLLGEQGAKITDMQATLVVLGSMKSDLEATRDRLVAAEKELTEVRQRLNVAKEELASEITHAEELERTAEAKGEARDAEQDRALQELQQAQKGAEARLGEAERALRELRQKFDESQWRFAAASGTREQPPAGAPPAAAAAGPSGPPASAADFGPPPVPGGAGPVPALQVERFDMMSDLSPEPAPPASPAPMDLTAMVDLSGAPGPSPVQQVVEPQKPAAKARGVAPIALALVAAVVVLGGAAFHLRGHILKLFLKGKATPGPGAPAAPPKAPQGGAPPPAAVSGDPEAVIDLVRLRPFPGGGTLGRNLEALFPPPKDGQLPWSVDRQGPDAFQVNYYPNVKPPVRLSFLVRPSSGLVEGANSEGVAALEGRLPARPAQAAPPAPAPKARRPRRRKSVVDSALDSGPGDILITGGLEEPAIPPPKRTRSRKPPAKAAGPAEGEEEASPSEELDLDQLLLPGVPQPVKRQKKARKAPRKQELAEPAGEDSAPEEPGS